MEDSAQIRRLLVKVFPDECLLVGDSVTTMVAEGKRKLDASEGGRRWPAATEAVELLIAAAHIVVLALEIYRELRRDKGGAAPSADEVNKALAAKPLPSKPVPKEKVTEIVIEVVAGSSSAPASSDAATPAPGSAGTKDS